MKPVLHQVGVHCREFEYQLQLRKLTILLHSNRFLCARESVFHCIAIYCTYILTQSSSYVTTVSKTSLKGHHENTESLIE